jgi:DNA-directed RNA polymerase subunit F
MKNTTTNKTKPRSPTQKNSDICSEFPNPKDLPTILIGENHLVVESRELLISMTNFFARLGYGLCLELSEENNTIEKIEALARERYQEYSESFNEIDKTIKMRSKVIDLTPEDISELKSAYCNAFNICDLDLNSSKELDLNASKERNIENFTNNIDEKILKKITNNGTDGSVPNSVSNSLSRLNPISAYL